MGLKDTLQKISKTKTKATGHYNIKINPVNKEYTFKYEVPIPRGYKAKIAKYLFDQTEKHKDEKIQGKADIEKGLSEIKKRSEQANSQLDHFRSKFLETVKLIEKDIQKNHNPSFKVYTYYIDDYDFMKKHDKYLVKMVISGDCSL